MRKNLILAAAVAASFGAGLASAAQVDVYVSGSSALQTFFQKDLLNSICGNPTTAAVSLSYKDTTLASTAGQPGYTYYSCIATGTVTGFAAGTTYAVHYASDLGSTWGVAGAINTALTRNTIVSATGCCNDTAHYDRVNDKSTALNANGAMSQHASDILTFDVEPTLFGANGGDNWPNSNSDPTFIPNALATTPTASQLGAISTTVLNGQIFSVIVNNGLKNIGNTSGQFGGSLSTNSIRAILTGNYGTWNQVPEVGSVDTGTPIVLCRRDHGSGSEIAASLTFTGTECGVSSNTIATAGLPVSLSNVVENPTTADVRTCVNTTAGGIGIAGVSTSASYSTVAVDGYYPNSHNSAAGHYNFAYEDHATDNTAHSGASTAAKAVVSTLLAHAASQTFLNAYYSETLPTSAATTGQGYNTAAAGTGLAGYYAAADVNTLPGNYVTNGSFKTATLPISLFARAGSSCSAKSNTNN